MFVVLTGLAELADFETEEEPELMFDVLSGLVELADFEAEEEPDPIIFLKFFLLV